MSRETGMTYMGPCILAILALVTDDPRIRDEALEEGRSWRRDRPATTTSCSGGTPSRYASGLPIGIAPTAMRPRSRSSLVRVDPWTDYIVSRGQALAAWGRGGRDDLLVAELARLRNEGERLGLNITIPAIESALAGKAWEAVGVPRCLA